MDGVGADIEIVKGGNGNDLLTAYGIVTTDVVLIGNGGNDTLTGGGGNDDLCGGAGDDRIMDNAGNDYIVGGAGFDTIDYTGATPLVTACLNPLDTVAGKPCATTNGALGEKDVVNSTAVLKVCPRATLTVGLGGIPTVTAVPPHLAGRRDGERRREPHRSCDARERSLLRHPPPVPSWAARALTSSPAASPPTSSSGSAAATPSPPRAATTSST